MLGLPKSTECQQIIPKKVIYAKNALNTAAKAKLDADIKRVTIVNIVSPSNVAIAAGENVKSFCVALVALKQEQFDKKSIVLLTKLVKQNMLMILEFNGTAKLAVCHSKLISGEWKSTDELTVQLNGLNFDSVWENIIVQVGGILIEQGNTLDEQIRTDEQRQKLLKQIDTLEKKARAEKQPKKKFEMAEKIKALRAELYADKEDLRVEQ